MCKRDVEEEACKKRHDLGVVDEIMVNMGKVQAYRNMSRGQDTCLRHAPQGERR